MYTIKWRTTQLINIYKAGMSMSINTDARTISAVSLSHEYELMVKQFYWQKSHFLKCNLEAIRHSFASASTRRKLARRIRKGFNRIN